MKLDISVKYLLKSLDTNPSYSYSFYLGWKDNQKMQECFMRSSDALSVPLFSFFQ